MTRLAGMVLYLLAHTALAQSAGDCAHTAKAPSAQAGGPTLAQPVFKGCARDARCGATAQVCSWTFVASGNDLPREKHSAYKKTSIALSSGALVPAFDSDAPSGSTYSVKGCFRGSVRSAVVLQNNGALRSNALCLLGTPPANPVAASAPKAPAPVADLPKDAKVQRALILAAYSEGIKGYMFKYPSAVANFYRNGTLSNLNESLKALFRYGTLTGESMDFERGCAALQGATRQAIEPVMTRPGILWEDHRLVVGRGFEHHAIAIFRKGTSMEAGYVLDPWLSQTSDVNKAVFTFAAWKARVLYLVAFGKPRLED